MPEVVPKESERIGRLIGFLHDLDRSIKNNMPFSFSARAHANKVNWNPHATNIRSIMIDNEYVVQSGAKNSFKWGAKLSDPVIPMEDIAHLILGKIKKAKDLHDYPMGKPDEEEVEVDEITQPEKGIPELTEFPIYSSRDVGPDRGPDSRASLATAPLIPLPDVVAKKFPVMREVAREWDEIELAVVKRALSKIILTEQDPIYLELAKKVFNKL
jgi:hypothetical protein